MIATPLSASKHAALTLHQIAREREAEAEAAAEALACILGVEKRMAPK